MRHILAPALGGAIGVPRMKLKDMTESSGRWSTPLGTLDANAQVATAVCC